jgi:hypothetical protein
MGRVSDWILEMEAESISMSREMFIQAYGQHQVEIWDRMNNPDYIDPSDYLEPDPEAYA